MSFAATWMNLKDIILQNKPDKQCIVLLICQCKTSNKAKPQRKRADGGSRCQRVGEIAFGKRLQTFSSKMHRSEGANVYYVILTDNSCIV